MQITKRALFASTLIVAASAGAFAAPLSSTFENVEGLSLIEPAHHRWWHHGGHGWHHGWGRRRHHEERWGGRRHHDDHWGRHRRGGWW